MGNTPTKSSDSSVGKKLPTLVDRINKIAYGLIITQNFQDMKKLENEKYCNNLIILTSKILKKFFNDREITYLAQKQKEGKIVNITEKDYLGWISRSTLNKADFGRSDTRGLTQTKRNRYCKGIAKFYIKIAHIFAAIVSTINPYYKDAIGNKKTFIIKDMAKKPEEIQKPNQNATFKKRGICQQRLIALKPTINDNTMTISPKPCDFLQVKYRDPNKKCITVSKPLTKQIGIPELKSLYYDKWNPDTGNFTAMSSNSRKQYLNDVKTFYTAFTGEKTVPPDVTSFSQIKMKNFYCKHALKCDPRMDLSKPPPQLPTAVAQPIPATAPQPISMTTTYYAPQQHIPVAPAAGGARRRAMGGGAHLDDTKNYHIAVQANSNNEYFKEYGKHWRKMKIKAEQAQESLISVINILFDVKDNTINPNLSEDDLNKIMIQTRKYYY